MHCIPCIVLHCIVYTVIYALYNMHYIISIVLYALYYIYCILCILCHALYFMRCIYALYTLHCIVFYALCTMHGILCIELYAIHNILLEHSYLLWNSLLTDHPTNRWTMSCICIELLSQLKIRFEQNVANAQTWQVQLSPWAIWTITL